MGKHLKFLHSQNCCCHIVKVTKTKRSSQHFLTEAQTPEFAKRSWMVPSIWCIWFGRTGTFGKRMFSANLHDHFTEMPPSQVVTQLQEQDFWKFVICSANPFVEAESCPQTLEKCHSNFLSWKHKQGFIAQFVAHSKMDLTWTGYHCTNVFFMIKVEFCGGSFAFMCPRRLKFQKTVVSGGISLPRNVRMQQSKKKTLVWFWVQRLCMKKQGIRFFVCSANTSAPATSSLAMNLITSLTTWRQSSDTHIIWHWLKNFCFKNR